MTSLPPGAYRAPAGLLRYGRAPIRRILVTTDLTPASETAFAHAALLAATLSADLTVYHSIDLRKVARKSGRGRAMADALQRAEMEAVRDIQARLAPAGVSARVRVEYGLAPPQAVVAAIAAARPDITVMSTHGRRGMAHLVLGSIAEAAIEQGGRPVLCVRGRRHAPAAPYRRILVPTDLRSRGVFPVAASLADAFHAEVIALHVVPFERASLSGLPVPVPRARPSEADVAAFLEPEFAGLDVRGRVVLGRGWKAIPDVAEEEGCALVALSTHRQDSLGDAMLGSRAERVVAVSPCPVLVV
jgi:nucleotide-binding universal stress UspA family protein